MKLMFININLRLHNFSESTLSRIKLAFSSTYLESYNYRAASVIIPISQMGETEG